ncbi:hypothetical protein [Streptomyces sp. ISL-10]|uniref:DUF6924 domain-containing protein n=1 Tax=Streptomyces sp. ISL-10 TaxID=2819172 RepID=UPI0035AB8947
MHGQELIGDPPPRQFRTVPAGVHTVHANLSIADMDSEDFAEAALTDPGVCSDPSRRPAGRCEPVGRDNQLRCA